MPQLQVVVQRPMGTGWISREHPFYERRNRWWEFMRISYEGGQEYLEPTSYTVDFSQPVFERNTDGTLTTVSKLRELAEQSFRSMLYRHNREKLWEYYNRNRRARYFNIVKPTVNSLVSHAMKAGVTREGPEPLMEFWRATDEKRTVSADIFMRQMLRKANTFGLYWVCVDVAEDGDGKPYAYGVSPQDITDWHTDDDGNIEWLKQYISTERQRTYKDQFQSVSRYRIWTKTEIVDYEVNEIGGSEVLLGSRPNPLGRVPFEPVFSQHDEESDFPNGASVVADVAKVANGVFNKCSLLDEILYKQTFAWLIVPDPSKSLDALQIGVNTAFGYDPGGAGGKPEYISPDADNARVLIESIGVDLEQAKATLGVSRGRSETSKDQASAEALELESDDKKSLLADIANAGKDAETRIANLVLAYMNQEPSDEVRIVYPHEFDIRSFKADIDEALAFQKLGLPPGVNAQLKTDLVRRKWGESLAPDKLDKLIAEVEAAMEPTVPQGERADGAALDKATGKPQDPSKRQPGPPDQGKATGAGAG